MSYITSLQAARVRIRDLELREQVAAEAFHQMKARAEKAEAALKAFIAAEDSFRANTGMPYPSGEGDDMSEAYTLAKAVLAESSTT
jgi:regulator of protease activity HflC (stomatin/prohibitin superfamily)